MDNRSFFLDLAARGVRMPIGTDLVLSECPHPEAVKLDGSALGTVMERAARRWHTPLAIPLMDLTVEKEWLALAMGVPPAETSTWHWHGVVPGDLPDAPLTPRLAANNAAIRHIASATGLLPCGMCIGPFSLMTKLVEDPITPVYLSGLGEDDDEDVRQMEKLLALATRLVLKVIDHQIDAGAKAMIVCEPAANTVYFSPKQLDDGVDTFDRYVMAHNQRIASHLAARGVSLIFHDCGELTPGLVAKIGSLRPDMLSLGSSRLLWEDAALVPSDVVLYGNLPTKKFYSDETMPVARVRQLASDMLVRMQSTGHPFILGSECDVLSVPGSEKSIREKVQAFLDVRVP